MAASPPSFNPPVQQSGSKVWLWILIAVVAFCLLAATGLFFLGKSALNQGMGLVSCGANADLARKAVLAYAQDHDGQLPNAETWQDDVRPNYEKLYEKMMSDKDMKDMPEWMNFKIAEPGFPLTCSVGPETTTGFAYNALLAKQNLKDIKDPGSTIVIWETRTPGYNANGDPSTRGKPGEKFKLFGQERDYIDMFIEGEADFMQSGNSDFDFEIKPEDGTVNETPAPENPEPRPKEEVK